MKTKITLIFIVYLLLFAVLGMIFYRILLKNSSPGENSFSAETVSPETKIYFSRNQIIYRLAPEKAGLTAGQNLETFSQQGEVGNLTFDKNINLAAFEVKNAEGRWEIWKANPANFEGSQIAKAGDLAGFQDFQTPKFSPSGEKLAFIGTATSQDKLLIYNVKTAEIKEYGGELGAKFSDYSWDKEGQRLALCSSNLSLNACWRLDMESQGTQKLFEENIKEISWNHTAEIIYLTQAETPHIFRRLPEENPAQIDNLSTPKKIISFQVAPLGENIVYQVLDLASQGSDLYFSQIDSANRLQLTREGENLQPLFSPDGSKIAFLRQKDGLYSIETDKTNLRKILESSEAIDRLLAWR